MTGSNEYPRLTPSNHRVTSPATTDDNCIAWAHGDVERWWQPGVYWQPADGPENDVGLDARIRVFSRTGYVACGLDTSLEHGFEKVALSSSGDLYTHAARQLAGGKWTS